MEGHSVISSAPWTVCSVYSDVGTNKCFEKQEAKTQALKCTLYLVWKGVNNSKNILTGNMSLGFQNVNSMKARICIFFYSLIKTIKTVLSYGSWSINSCRWNI